jgi:2-phospho-L-lactate transferase/gluconeogenesis factor (CofD/UPF0052 family)
MMSTSTMSTPRVVAGMRRGFRGGRRSGGRRCAGTVTRARREGRLGASADTWSDVRDYDVDGISSTAERSGEETTTDSTGDDAGGETSTSESEVMGVTPARDGDGTSGDAVRGAVRTTPSDFGFEAPPKLVVFSGGTAMNTIADELSAMTQKVTHVIPVSDNGGSTSEVVRVLGGPAVGDLRSRCLRLTDDSTPEAVAVKELLGYRLHPTDSDLAREEWYRIQEGNHPLWEGIGQDYANIIRRFLVHFHVEVSSKPIKERFDFVNGSIGNFFFAGARLFFRSMDAAIFLYSRVSRIPDDTVIAPCILHKEDERVNLAAELVDGTILRGQNEISHPSIDSKKFSKNIVVSSSSKSPDVVSKEFWTKVLTSGELPESEPHEMWGGLAESSGGFKSVRAALASGSLIDAAELLKSRFDDIADTPLSVWDVNKVVTAYDPLPSPIKRVFYASSLEESDDNFEVHPKPNPTVIENMVDADAIVYGMGSLYTSIIPNIGLKGMGGEIAKSKGKKILMLNGCTDRETGSMRASDVVQAIVDAVNMRYTSVETTFTAQDIITDVVAPRDGGIALDMDVLDAMGVVVHQCDSDPAPNMANNSRHYDAHAFVRLLGDIIKSA